MKSIVVALAFGLLTISCTSSEAEAESVTGIVLGAKGSKPLGGVDVKVGSQTVTTNAAGRYVLRNVAKGTMVRFELCGYAPGSASVPETEPYVIDTELLPLSTTGEVLSNITGDGIRGATVSSGKSRSKTTKDGHFVLEPYCNGSEMHVKAPGYSSRKVIDAAGDENLQVKLVAGPAKTWEQMSQWWSEFKWNKLWSWKMRDSKKWLTKTDFVFDAEQGVQRGFQSIGTKILGIHIGPWTMPACLASQQDFGPKTYKKVASIRNIEYRSGPSGSDASYRAVNHLIYDRQTKRWTWVPLAGCQYTPGGFD